MEEVLEQSQSMKTARANQVVDELVHQDPDQATRGASREIATLRNIQLGEAQDALVASGCHPIVVAPSLPRKVSPPTSTTVATTVAAVSRQVYIYIYANINRQTCIHIVLQIM